MPTIDDIITEIEGIEGGSKLTNSSTDKGGETVYGISKVSNPEAFVNGPPSESQARTIYRQKYVIGPGFDKVPPPLQIQLVDFGVNSGPMVAILKLQVILGVKTDGVLGPDTFTALAKADIVKVNNLLLAARIRMIAQIVKKSPSQLTYLNGWIERALQFLV